MLRNEEIQQTVHRISDKNAGMGFVIIVFVEGTHVVVQSHAVSAQDPKRLQYWEPQMTMRDDPKTCEYKWIAEVREATEAEVDQALS